MQLQATPHHANLYQTRARQSLRTRTLGVYCSEKHIQERLCQETDGVFHAEPLEEQEGYEDQLLLTMKTDPVTTVTSEKH